MADIKSALELALEKAEQYGRASREEMDLAQHQELGRKLAVQFLKGEGDLTADLKSLPPQTQPAARMAIKEVFLRNLGLPRENAADPRQDRAVEGLLLVASDRKAMAQIQMELEQVLQQFIQFRNNALQQLKAPVCRRDGTDAEVHGGAVSTAGERGRGAPAPVPGRVAPV